MFHLDQFLVFFCNSKKLRVMWNVKHPNELTSTLRQKHRKLLPFHGRGLADLQERVGDIPKLVKVLLETRSKVRVLELGCGFGFALMELRKLFGDRVVLFGLNKNEAHGNWALFRKVALAKGLYEKVELDEMAPISIAFANAGEAIPFPGNYFDIIFSQVSFMYYGNKARCLEEINRVLCAGGVARIDMRVVREGLPMEYATGFEIWEKSRQIPFSSFVQRFDSMVEKRARGKTYLEMTKAKTLDLGLELVQIIDLDGICADWWGTKTIYKISSRKVAKV